MEDYSVDGGSDGERGGRLTVKSAAWPEPSKPRRVSIAESTFSHSVNFELLPVWKKRNRATCSQQAVDRIMSMSAKPSEALDFSASLQEFNCVTERPEWLCGIRILHPSSPLAVLVDVLSILLVMYDSFMLPLSLLNPSTDQGYSKSFAAMDWVTRVWWTASILITFFCGFVDRDGSIQMKPSRIAQRYLRTWFVLDVALVGLDWSEAFIEETSINGSAALSKLPRVLRGVRMLRLLRLLKVGEILEAMTEQIRTPLFFISVDLGKTLALILFVAHIIACLWYSVGVDSGGKNWVQDLDLEDAPFRIRYIMSMHWALAQFAGGMDEIRPHSENERIFAIAVAIFALVVTTVFVGRLTSSMTQLQVLSSSNWQQFLLLRDFLQEKKISRRLDVRINRSIRYAIKEGNRTTCEEHVELLQLLSESLRVELHFEIYSPVLMLHPFFYNYAKNSPQVLRKVCHVGASMLHFSPGDVVFTSGECNSRPRMYVVCCGRLQYTSIDGITSQVVYEPDAGMDLFISEAVLWTSWAHFGTLTAMSHARLCTLDAKAFQTIVSQFSHASSHPAEYAKFFVDELNTQHGEGVTDLSFCNAGDFFHHNNQRRSSVWATPDGLRRRATGGSRGGGPEAERSAISSWMMDTFRR